jgi:uncharacterized membrane protein
MAFTAVHVLAGALALITGYVALFTRKGATKHRRSGMVFVYAMVVMALTGAVMAALHGVRTDTLMGLLTVYLVVTGLTTIRRPGGGSRRVDAAAMALGLAVGGALLALGLAGGDPASSMPAPMYFVFAAVGLSAGLADLGVIRSGTVPAARRLPRHLWRMCFALFIAATSFFLGQADLFPAALRNPALLGLPVLVVVGAMVYWLWRVRFRSAVRQAWAAVRYGQRGPGRTRARFKRAPDPSG